MEESILDFELVDGPQTKQRQGQQSMNYCRFDHRAESLTEIKLQAAG
jgi:hypothetical protein